MKRPLTLPVDAAVLDQIRAAMQGAGLQPMSADQVAGMAVNLGLRDILRSYAKLADIERAHRRPTESMVTPPAWEGALDVIQAS